MPTNQLRPVSLHYVAVGLMLASTCYYWYCERANADARVAVTQLRAATPFPTTLNGLKIELRGLKPADKHEQDNFAIVPPQNAPKLIIVVSDDCGPCLEEVPKWRELLAKGFRGEVLLISVDGVQIIDELTSLMRARRQPRRVFQIRQPQEFQLATGILSTPSMLLLDSEDRVRLVTNRVDVDSIEALTAYIVE